MTNQEQPCGSFGRTITSLWPQKHIDFAWYKLQPSPWKDLEESFPIVCSLFSWIWEGGWGVQRGLQQLNDLRENLELGLQRMTSLNSTLCHQGVYRWRLDGSGGWETGQRKKGRRSNWRREEIHDAEIIGIFFIWGSTVNFWGIGPEYRKLYKGCSSECTQCYGCHSHDEKKSYYPDVTGDFFSRG